MSSSNPWYARIGRAIVRSSSSVGRSLAKGATRAYGWAGGNISAFPAGSLVLFPDDLTSGWQLPRKVRPVPFENRLQRHLGVLAEQVPSVCRALEIDQRRLIDIGRIPDFPGVYRAELPMDWRLQHGLIEPYQKMHLAFCGLGPAVVRTAEDESIPLADLEEQQTRLTECLAEELRTERACLEDLNRLRQSGQDLGQTQTELRRLLECRQIEDVEVTQSGDSQSLIIHTVPLSLTHRRLRYLLGAYEIHLTRCGNYRQSVQVINKTLRVGCCDHPHVSRHTPCLGNISEWVYQAIRQRNFQQAAFAVLEYLQGGYYDLGVYARIERWPLWQEGCREHPHAPRKSPLAELGRLTRLEADYQRLAGQRACQIDQANLEVRQASERVVNRQVRLCRLSRRILLSRSLGQPTAVQNEERRRRIEGARADLAALLTKRVEVTDFEIVDRNSNRTCLIIRTGPLSMSHQGQPLALGRYCLSIFRDGQSGGLLVYNAGRTTFGYPHPYVGQDGRPRSENIQAALPHLLADRQYVVLAEMVLDFLKEPDGDLPAIRPEEWSVLP